jgi:hypothetical protein
VSQKPCPSCGYCPACKRWDVQPYIYPQPYWVYPYWQVPQTGQPWYGTTTITCNTNTA